MKKKIIIILAVLAVIVFGYYISQGSRFKKTEIFEPKKEQTANSSAKAADTENSNEQNNSDSNAVETAPDIEVKPADCDNNCQKFTKDDEKKYCQEICGTASYFEDPNDSGGSSDDCADEKGIQKDYCLKDIAVGNKDFKTCDKISDTSIKKSCRNRISEDLIEEQPNSFSGENQ